MRTCTISGCIDKHLAKGLCNRHLHRFYKYGDPCFSIKPKKRDGEFVVDSNGYERIKGNKHVHRVIAEYAFGKPLPKGACVHHVDMNPRNNNKTNLIICPSHSYHMLIHKRQAAFDSCGHAGWLKCSYCGKYDDPENMYVSKNHPVSYHRECRQKYKISKRKLLLKDEK